MGTWEDLPGRKGREKCLIQMQPRKQTKSPGKKNDAVTS